MMKITMPQIVKKLSCLLLTLTAAVTLHAQNDDRAFAAGIDSIISDKTLDYIVVDRIVDEIFEKHGKSAYLAYRIAKSYYQYIEIEENRRIDRTFAKNDTARAFKYINTAISIDPKFPDSYILASDITYWEKRPNGRDGAIAWLNKGVEIIPNDRSLYIALAEFLGDVDMNAAIEKLQELSKKDPSFPANLHIARMLWKINNKGDGLSLLKNVAEYYAKADRNIMEKGDLESFAYSLNHGGVENSASLVNDISEYGLKKHPRSLMLSQLFLRTLPPMKRFDEGQEAFERVLAAENPKGSNNATAWDYIAYGACLVGKNKFDEAMKLYDKVLSGEEFSNYEKEQTNLYVNQLMSQKVKKLTDVGDYNEAIAMYQNFIRQREEIDKANDNMYYTLANLYLQCAQEKNGTERVQAFLDADKAYENAVNKAKDKDNAITFAFARIYNIYFTELDKGADTGAAVPGILQFESLLLSARGGSLSKQEIARLIMAYQYMMSYYAYGANNYDTATDYANKIIALEKDNKPANDFLNARSNKGKRKGGRRK